MKLRLTGFSLLLVGAPAIAHDFWIQPARFQVAPSAAIPITFQVGHGADRQRWGNGLNRIMLLNDFSISGRRDIRGELQARGPADLVTRTKIEGLHVLAIQTTYAFSDLPAIRFNDFAKEEGLAAVLAARQRAGTTGQAGRERYSRRAKALIQVGRQTAANQRLATQAIGLKLEIVPERNPYALGVARILPVRVLYNGRRLSNALVKLTNLGNDAKPIAVKRTDGNGRASFQIPAAGAWLLNVIWSEPVQGDPKVEFDTTFSSLTFGQDPVTRSR